MKDFDDLEDPIKPYIEKDHIEFKIQIAIVDHITGRKIGTKAFQAFVCHIFQGRDAKDGFFLKMLGVVAGVADLLVLWRSKCACGAFKIGIGFLEVKKPGGIQSTPQKKFQGICHWLGINYAIVKSVKEAHATLLAWGCQENHHSIREPDIRSDTQKKKDAFDFYKK